MIFMGKSMVSGFDFPFNQAIECSTCMKACGECRLMVSARMYKDAQKDQIEAMDAGDS